MYKSAVLSAIIEVCVTHPIDVFKTRYQNNNSFTIKQFLQLSFKDKYRGFYGRSIGIIPMRTTFWISSEFANSTLVDYSISKLKKLLFSSNFTAFSQTLIDCPIENIKISSINNNKLYLKNIYRGFLPNFYRNSIFATSVLFFNQKINNNFISAGVGGFLGCIISQPIDYIKTLRQSNHKICFSDIIVNKFHRQNCMNGFYARSLQGFISMSLGYSIFKFLYSI